MREKLQTCLCMVLVLVIFTGCRGAGALIKGAVLVGYVALHVAAAAAKSRSSTPAPPESPQETCGCAPVPNGQTWCEKHDGDLQCVLQCDDRFVFRDGICAPRENIESN
jgi:hypothetical protein